MPRTCLGTNKNKNINHLLITFIISTFCLLLSLIQITKITITPDYSYKFPKFCNACKIARPTRWKWRTHCSMTTQRRRTLEDILLGKNRPTRTLEHLLLAKETRKKRDQPETWWQTSTNHIEFTRPGGIYHQLDKKPIFNRKVISTKNLLVVINNAKNISSYFTSNKHLLVYQIKMRLE